MRTVSEAALKSNLGNGSGGICESPVSHLAPDRSRWFTRMLAENSVEFPFSDTQFSSKSGDAERC